MSETPKRNSKGHFVKGKSGNPSGRPKKVVLDDKFREKLGNCKDKEEMFTLISEFLLQSADTKDELFRYFKEFAKYLAPSLKSVETKSKVDNTFTISWDMDIEKLPKEAKGKVIEHNEEND